MGAQPSIERTAEIAKGLPRGPDAPPLEFVSINPTRSGRQVRIQQPTEGAGAGGRKIYIVFHTGHYYNSEEFTQNEERLKELLGLNVGEIDTSDGRNPFSNVLKTVPDLTVYTVGATDLLSALKEVREGDRLHALKSTTHANNNPFPLSGDTLEHVAAASDTALSSIRGPLDDAGVGVPRVNTGSTDGSGDAEVAEIFDASTMNDDLAPSRGDVTKNGQLVDTVEAFGDRPRFTRKFVIHTMYKSGTRKWDLSLWVGPVFLRAEEEETVHHPDISNVALFNLPTSAIVMAGHLFSD